MSLADAVRNGVALASRMTAGLMVDVRHLAWIGQDGFDQPVYAVAFVRKALLEDKQVLRATAAGENVLSRTKLTFLDPIAANGAENRREPIDPRDEFEIVEGQPLGPVLSSEGLIDPKTGLAYLYSVYLG